MRRSSSFSLWGRAVVAVAGELLVLALGAVAVAVAARLLNIALC
jgi:hypothetical protein